MSPSMQDESHQIIKEMDLPQEKHFLLPKRGGKDSEEGSWKMTDDKRNHDLDRLISLGLLKELPLTPPKSLEEPFRLKVEHEREAGQERDVGQDPILHPSFLTHIMQGMMEKVNKALPWGRDHGEDAVQVYTFGVVGGNEEGRIRPPSLSPNLLDAFRSSQSGEDQIPFPGFFHAPKPQDMTRRLHHIERRRQEIGRLRDTELRGFFLGALMMLTTIMFFGTTLAVFYAINKWVSRRRQVQANPDNDKLFILGGDYMTPTSDEKKVHDHLLPI